MLSIELPANVEDRLAALAQRTGRPATDHALEAILEHLADWEDAQLSQDRLTNLRQGRSDTVPLSELLRRYGVEN